MILSEILAKIKRYYPKAATWTDAEIVSILNDEQREIFRELQIKDMYEFTTIADQWSYLLPSNCSVEFLEYVGLTEDATITSNSDFQEYTYADLNEEMSGYRYFDALNGLIGLYPMPDTSGWNIRLIFRKRPVLMSATILTATPELNEDWHRILVYGAIAEIAGSGSNPDTTTANNYTTKYNELLKEIKQSRYEVTPKYPKTKDVMIKRFRNRKIDLSYLNPYV
jgi:hypothetical protein